MNGDLVLLPAPQQITYLDGTCPVEPSRHIRVPSRLEPAIAAARIVQEALATVGPRWELTAAGGIDYALVGAEVSLDRAQWPRPEGYRLTIDRQRIRILAGDAAGAYYAAMTLKQIARQAVGSGRLPCLRVEDWPDFANRGVMLDVSKDKIPTLATLFEIVDLLSEWKINHLQLHTENAFAYLGHEEVWAEATPITGDDILALDAYCRERHVELVPNQNSFGHLERWLRLPRYRHLAETPDGAVDPWGKGHNEPFSLCPTDPASVEFLKGLYNQLLPHFTSRQFNVGCDETYELGMGRSKAECEARGVGRVYLDFLKKIHGLVRAHGRTMLFWDDIIRHDADLIADLPDDTVALEWGYSASHPFAENCAPFAKAGFPFYVCPGTSTWNTVAGQTDSAVANLRTAAEVGRSMGAVGYLNTDWGDHGHWNYIPASFLGFALGAALCWSVDAGRKLDLVRALDVHAFMDRAGVMGRLAFDLGNAYKVAGFPDIHGAGLPLILIFPDPARLERRKVQLRLEPLRAALEHIDRVLTALPRARMKRGDAALVSDEYENAAAILRHSCRLAIARLETGGDVSAISLKVRKELAGDMERIVAEHRRLWMARNRPGGLKDSVAAMEYWLARYRS